MTLLRQKGKKIARNATNEEIEKAYKKCVKKPIPGYSKFKKKGGK